MGRRPGGSTRNFKGCSLTNLIIAEDKSERFWFHNERHSAKGVTGGAETGRNLRNQGA
jgi:hypothetical protein